MWYELNKVGSGCGNNPENRIAQLERQVNQLIAQINNGLKGEKGDPGERGEKGDMGHRGPVGLTGAEGPMGPQGPKGEHGTSLKVKGEVQSLDELNTKPKIEGDGYLLNGEMHVWTGTIWQNVGKVQGPEGKPGARGDRGERGPQGEKGDTGSQGDRGLQGIPGPAGAAGAIGATGPRGERGPAGATGAIGPQGPRGERGFPGDRGPEGERGPKGDQGEKGDMPNFDDIEVSAVDHANDHTSSGYAKTTATTEGLPDLVNGNQNKGKWGLLVNKLENKDKGQGTQKYYPADGPYHGRVFTRSMNNVKTVRGGVWGDWKLTLNEDDTNMFLKKPTEDIRNCDIIRESGIYRTNNSVTQGLPPEASGYNKDGILKVWTRWNDLIVQEWWSARDNDLVFYRKSNGSNGWHNWQKLSGADLSNYYDRNHIDTHYMNSNDINRKFSDLVSFTSFAKPIDKNDGAITIGDFVIEWKTITTDRPSQSGGWAREIQLNHIGTLCTWAATVDLHNNRDFDYSVCQTKVIDNTHGRNKVRVAVSKGGTAIKLVAFGSRLGKQI